MRLRLILKIAKVHNDDAMMTCPHDGETLAWIGEGKRTVHQCPRCSGIWVPGRVVDEIVGRSGSGKELRGALSRRRSAIQCPEDQARLFPATHKHIELDLCLVCDGVWLDNGELNRISRNRPESRSSYSGSSVTDAVLDGAGNTVVDAAVELIGQAIVSLLDGI